MEDHPLRLLEPCDLLDVPGDSLALSVGVGGEVDLVGLRNRALYLCNDIALLGRDHVAGDEAARDIYRVFITLGQIADMADRGQDRIVLA